MTLHKGDFMALEDIDSRNDKNHRPKCIYLISQIKSINPKLGNAFTKELRTTDEDETWELYQKLLETYSGLERPAPRPSIN